MFRSPTIIRELVMKLDKVILKHSLKLCPYRLCGGVAACCRHNVENVYNDTYTGTTNVILAKHRLRLPDDGFM
jgi:hypothetical protein